MQKINSKIEAKDINLREILDTQKYSVDYFQREYRWESRHIIQLLDDLESNFLLSYDAKHGREDVENYNSYYLGPIVVSNQEEKNSIIDGQQRITSLTLLLVYLNNLQKEYNETEPIQTMIFSEKYGKKSYNLQIPERIECLDGLFNSGNYQQKQSDSESISNLIERYKDIESNFSNELKGSILPFFISWLKEKVIFVKIVTYSDENAYTIFETMNDRGLNLTPSEMLKGYLLSRIKEDNKRVLLNDKWKKHIAELHKLSKTEDLDFFRAWFRGKYAETIRQTKKGAENEDFEKIGTSFHIWFKHKEQNIGLKNSVDFEEFIGSKFEFYVNLYIKIHNAFDKPKTGLEILYYYDFYSIARSLSYPLLISSIKENDTNEVIDKKLSLVALFLERYTVIRMVNFRTISQSSMKYYIYSLVKEIRNKELTKLGSILKQKLIEQDIEVNFGGLKYFGLHQQNKPFVRYLLSRITHYIQEKSNAQSSMNTLYLMEIEHIWPDKFDWFRKEFEQRDEFNRARNSIGGLLLLPRGTNQSFNKDRYELKLPHYLKQNLLVQSLHSECYVKNPNFTKFYKAANLPFEPYDNFNTNEMDKRTELYTQICKEIFSLKQFDI